MEERKTLESYYNLIENTTMTDNKKKQFKWTLTDYGWLLNRDYDKAVKCLALILNPSLFNADLDQKAFDEFCTAMRVGASELILNKFETGIKFLENYTMHLTNSNQEKVYFEGLNNFSRVFLMKDKTYGKIDDLCEDYISNGDSKKYLLFIKSLFDYYMNAPYRIRATKNGLDEDIPLPYLTFEEMMTDVASSFKNNFISALEARKIVNSDIQVPAATDEAILKSIRESSMKTFLKGTCFSNPDEVMCVLKHNAIKKALEKFKNRYLVQTYNTYVETVDKIEANSICKTNIEKLQLYSRFLIHMTHLIETNVDEYYQTLIQVQKLTESPLISKNDYLSLFSAVETKSQTVPKELYFIISQEIGDASNQAESTTLKRLSLIK